MKNKIKNHRSLIKLLISFWLLGCLNIIYFGFQIDPYLSKHEPEHIYQYPIDGVILISLFFSSYFIVTYFLALTSFNQKHPFLSCTILSIITFIQLLIVYSSAMHAPPFMWAYMINVFILFFFHLALCVSIIRHKKKSSQ